MSKEFGFKELYDVVIKSTSNMKVNGKEIEKDETVIAFDRIQIGNFQEIRKITTANGGFDNRPHVWWETVKDVSISFSQGVFSKEHLAMMVNAQIFKLEDENTIYINKREFDLETDENNEIELKSKPYAPCFVYKKETGEKINYTYIERDNKYILKLDTTPYTEVIADYTIAYKNGYSFIRIGEEISHNYFVLEGKTRVKDDETGQVRTGLIRIPKLKLVSDLSMRLGSNAAPVMGSFDAVACPTGVKGNTTVMELIFLNDDIDTDM